MRRVPVLMLLAHVVIVNAASAQRAKPRRLDVNGDPLPAGAVARLGALRFQPRGPVRAAALSPDGKTVAAARHGRGGATEVEFLDASTGKSVRTLDLADVASSAVASARMQ